MKRNYILLAFLLFTALKLSAQTCSCTSVNNYGVEYPNTGNVQVSNAAHFFYISPAELSSGNTVHFYFPKAPCNPTVNNPCYGTYKASINGHVINSIGGATVNQHIQIPVAYLVVGTNNIIVTATCGTTVCNMPATTINVVAPSSASASITLTAECCQTISGPQHTPAFTGEVRFKMTGTASTGVKLRITSGAGIFDQNFQAATGIGDGYTGCYTGTITFTVLDALNNILTNATINGQLYNTTALYHYKYAQRFSACRNVINTGPHTGIFGTAGAVYFSPAIELPDLGNLVLNPATGLYVGVEIPWVRNNPKPGPRLSILADASYSRFSVDNALSLVNKKYPVEGQQSPTKRFVKTPEKASIFAAGVAPKITWDIKRLSVSISAMAGYQHISLPGMSLQDDSVKNNGTNLIYLQMPAYKKGGLFILPQFELGYWLSGRIGLSVGAGYNIGPKMNLSVQTLAASDFNKDGVYSKAELAKGSLNTASVTVNSNYVRLNAGLIISLTRRSDFTGHVSLMK